MNISIVVAVAENGAIGKDNALLWRLPDDLKRFKAVTLGNPIIMGRKTHDSIGRPLPGRLNIVISRQPGLRIEGCVVVDSLDAAFKAAGDAPNVAVVGGADIYRQALPRASVVHLTEVHASFDGDVFFPDLSRPDLSHGEWLETTREPHPADERHAYAFTFVTLRRKP